MLDRKTWLEAQPFTGIQRTADGGKTWTLVDRDTPIEPA